jgi:hypothetical protein
MRYPHCHAHTLLQLHSNKVECAQTMRSSFICNLVCYVLTSPHLAWN